MNPVFDKRVLSYKYAQIKTDLSIRILDGSLKPHERIPSLNGIATQYGVSKITARRVLNDLVSEGLVYAVRGKGSFVADTSSYPQVKLPKSGQYVGVVFENASGVFMSDIIKGIDEDAFELGMHINLCLSNDSYEREAEILTRLAERGITKILLFMVLSDDEDALNPNLPLYLSLQERGVQLVLIDCYLPNVPIPSISWDDLGGLKSLVEYVHDLGCRNLAYVTRVNNAVSVAERFRGFKEGLLARQLPYEPRRVLQIRRGDGASLSENSRKEVLALLKERPVPDAILCSDEEVAFGVFQALEETGGAIASQVRVGGFGNPKSIYLQGGHPYILLEQNSYELGRMAAEIALKSPGFAPGSNGKVLRRVLPVGLREL